MGCWLQKMPRKRKNTLFLQELNLSQYLVWLLVEISAGLVRREEKRRKQVGKGHLTLGICSMDCFTGAGDS